MCVKKENFNSRGCERGGGGANCILLLKTNNTSTYMRLMGGVELYAIYQVLICFVYTLPLPDTLIVCMRFYIFKIVFLS